MKKIALFILSLAMGFISFPQTTIYMKNEGGVYTIPCTVNGLKLRFILDTGASDVSISLTEAIFMVKNDYLSENDIYGISYARLANGEITENTEILLKEIEIAGLKLYNVRASVVHELSAPLLLGLSAIEMLGAIQLEGNKLTILRKGNNTSYNYANNYSSGYNNSNSNSNSTFPSKSSSSDKYYSGVQEVYTCSPIYPLPYLNGNLIAQACDAKVTVIQRVNEKCYKVKSGNTEGYMSTMWFKN